METVAYQGRIFEIVNTEVEEAGKVKVFEYARRSPGVRLILCKGNTVLIMKEFRREHGAYDYHLPGGKVFDSLAEYRAYLNSGQDMTEAAATAVKKEAREEVGCTVNTVSHFHTSVCGATVLWDLYYFASTDFSEGEQHLEDGEDISYEFLSYEDARRMCLDGSIREERSALVLLKYLDGK